MGGLGFLRGGLERGGVVVVVASLGLEFWSGGLYDTALRLACTCPGRTLYAGGCLGWVCCTVSPPLNPSGNRSVSTGCSLPQCHPADG